MEKLIYMRK